MSDLRNRIAAALSEHRARWGEWVTCSCDDDFSRFSPEVYEQHVADAVIRELLPTREGKWGWMDGTVSTNPQTGNPVKLEIEPGEVIPLSVEDARNVALALLAAVAELEADK